MRELYEMHNTVVEITSQDEFNEYEKMRRDGRWYKPYFHYDKHKKNGFYHEISDLSSTWNKYQIKGFKIITLDELKRRLSMYKQGDILVKDGDHKCKILGVCGEVMICSYNNDFNMAYKPFTRQELNKRGYKLHTPEEEMVELTFDDISAGKGVGVDPKNIKIKK